LAVGLIIVATAIRLNDQGTAARKRKYKKSLQLN
jgi:hypothetical protein